ncbi:substrate-binding domain-containing protein [Homoserinibacter sp. GY 40078]|uniref:LacI family DNA-binding transcriptional regulator n=1 Tax=Homoserinibacter sp. GY 40078 TaxID=2603275 RepID=UPI0011CA9AFD|nr:substrate-binding domain-containing protein [Homoserinibacter sp. GY 40078]TXK19380.1 LacI family transcriptional regulator [Homoserinibacter sp. GY 40078]
MADVANLAGVSVPTVSRVLSGSVPVSDEKRRRVETAVEALSFRPSAAARVLASRRPEVVAIITGDTSRYGYAHTIRGVEVAARSAGYTVMITVVESADPADVDAALEATLSQPIAGVVVLAFDPQGVAALHRIPGDIRAVALSGLREPGRAQAMIDETRAAHELVTHLLQLGHRTVHHVRIPPSRREDGRTTGWRRALRSAGVEVPRLWDADWNPDTGRRIGHQLATDPEITAVFCGNDEIAMGVIRGLQDRELRVPEDVSVVGFDDHPLARLWTPALTTVRQDFFDLGGRGFDLLVERIEGGPARLSSQRPALVVRESAGPPAPAGTSPTRNAVTALS